MSSTLVGYYTFLLFHSCFACRYLKVMKAIESAQKKISQRDLFLVSSTSKTYVFEDKLTKY